MIWWWRWIFSNSSSQLRNGTKAGSDDAAAGSKVHSFDFDLCCSEIALIYVVLIDFDLWCSETAKVKIRTPMCLIYVFQKWFKILKNAIFPQGKTKDGVDTKEIMKRRRERAICIVSALCTKQFHVWDTIITTMAPRFCFLAKAMRLKDILAEA